MQISAPAPLTAPGNLLFVGIKRTMDAGVRRDELRDVRMYRSDKAGSATGYASLENAINAASFITSEDHLKSSAVAAVREGARFVLYRVRERFEHPENGFRTPGARANFEPGARWGYIAEQPYYEHSALRALIDGTHVQRFHPGAVAPGVRP